MLRAKLYHFAKCELVIAHFYDKELCKSFIRKYEHTALEIVVTELIREGKVKSIEIVL